MSIIHDALKKVQQSLNPKPEAPAAQPAAPQAAPGYIYDSPPQVESVEPKIQQAINLKIAQKRKNNHTLTICACLAVIAFSGYYIYQEFELSIPKVQQFARASYFKIVHHKDIPAFKNKTPEELKPLAKIIVNPPAANAPAAPGTGSPAPAPVTLNIHGIMANASGNLVLINDQVYQEGDEVDGTKILKIGLDSITVNNNGVEQVIPVKS